MNATGSPSGTRAVFSQRLVLRKNPARELMHDYSRRMGWPILEETQSEEEIRSRVITLEIGGYSNLVYTEDTSAGECYVYAKGRSRAVVERLALSIAEDLEPWSVRELAEAIDRESSSAGLVRLLARLGLSAPYSFDETVFMRLARALRHESASVRLEAVYALSYSPWPEYEPILGQLAAQDPDEEVRELARDILKLYQEARKDD